MCNSTYNLVPDATESNNSSLSVAIGLGGQASRAVSRGPLELAQNVAPLMESGAYEAALELTRNAGIDSPQIAQLHGDIITAILSRDEKRRQVHSIYR